MLDNLKRPAQPREAVLIALVMIGVVYAGFIYYIQPLEAQVLELKNKLATTTEEADAIDKFNAVIRKNQQEQIQTFEQVADESSKDPRVLLIKRHREQPYKFISDFLRDITSPGFRSSVTIDSLKYDKRKTHSGYFSTGFSMVVNGNYSRVISYVKRLEKIEALVTLSAVELSRSKGDANTVTLNLKGVYYQLDDEKI